MLIPSIDLMDGQAVQLIGGKTKALDAGDPRPIAERFRLAGEIAVIDLDAALGRGNNAALIKELIKLAPCRVGGGIRDVDSALAWLDAGASKVILGTRAVPEILRELPKDRVIAALDAVDGEVVVEGWREKTGRSVLGRMRELEGLAGGFLVTFVEREGRLAGIDGERIGELVSAAGTARLTIAGGVRNAADIGLADRLGADAQVGMALYTHALDLADAILGPLLTEGAIPTAVTDANGQLLGLERLEPDALRTIIRNQACNQHRLLRVDLGCRRDTVRLLTARNEAPYCERGPATCFGPEAGLEALFSTLSTRKSSAEPGSYTHRLLEDPQLLAAKLIEEAGELSRAEGIDEVASEAADLFYFAVVALVRAGVPLAAVGCELDRRALKVKRRPGNAKPGAIAALDRSK